MALTFFHRTTVREIPIIALICLSVGCVDSGISGASWQLERVVYRTGTMHPDSTHLQVISSDNLAVRLVMGAASGDLVDGKLVASGTRLTEFSDFIIDDVADVEATQASDGRVTLMTTLPWASLTWTGSVSHGLLVLTEVRVKAPDAEPTSPVVLDSVVLRRVESSSVPASIQVMVKGLLESHDEWSARHVAARQVAAMKSDLRNLTTAEESYFADHYTYSSNKRALGYSESPGITVTIDVVGGIGYSAIASHADTDITCAIFMNQPVRYPATTEGSPGCTVR